MRRPPRPLLGPPAARRSRSARRRRPRTRRRSSWPTTPAPTPATGRSSAGRRACATSATCASAASRSSRSPTTEATAALADLRDADGVRWAQADPTAHAFGAGRRPVPPARVGARRDRRARRLGRRRRPRDHRRRRRHGRRRRAPRPRRPARPPRRRHRPQRPRDARGGRASRRPPPTASASPAWRRGRACWRCRRWAPTAAAPCPAVADAEDRAADLGARVINLSLGSDGPSLAERTVIRAHPDVLFVAAAGNQARDDDAQPTYPCAYDEPNVLCVGAEGRAGGLASFSNWGARSVDLLAPGEHIASTWTGGAYRYADGTSMAAPFASAAAAALLGRDPALTPRAAAGDPGRLEPPGPRRGRPRGRRRPRPRARAGRHRPRGRRAAREHRPAAAAPPAGTTAAAPPARPARPGAQRRPPARQPGARLPRRAPRRPPPLRLGPRRRAARRSRARCRARTVEVRWRLARRATVGLAFERRACRAGRCRWTVVRRVRASAPAGTAARRLGAAPGGPPARPRALPPARRRARGRAPDARVQRRGLTRLRSARGPRAPARARPRRRTTTPVTTTTPSSADGRPALAARGPRARPGLHGRRGRRAACSPRRWRCSPTPAHMLTDAGGDRPRRSSPPRLAARPARGRFTFGLGRAEILSAQANGVDAARARRRARASRRSAAWLSRPTSTALRRRGRPRRGGRERRRGVGDLGARERRSLNVEGAMASTSLADLVRLARGRRRRRC